MLGALFALLSAATFAWNNASVRRGGLSGTATQALAITVPLGTVMFAMASLVAGQSVFQFSARSIAFLCSAGLVHFLWGRYCNYRASMAIGSNLVAPVQQCGLIVSLGLAVTVLGESLTPTRVVGILLILIGPTFTMRSVPAKPKPTIRQQPEVLTKSGQFAPFQPRYLEGYSFAVVSAVAYGTSPILISLGLRGHGLEASFVGGLVSYATATICILLFLLWPRQFWHVVSMRRDAARWFLTGGLLVGVSQIFTFMAMSIAPVSVVVPIQRLSMVFRIYASKTLSPNHEVFGSGVWIGTVVSLLGAVILSLSTEWVLSIVTLPEAVTALLRWRWP